MVSNCSIHGIKLVCACTCGKSHGFFVYAARKAILDMGILPQQGKQNEARDWGRGITAYAKSQITYEMIYYGNAEWDTGAHFPKNVSKQYPACSRKRPKL